MIPGGNQMAGEGEFLFLDLDLLKNVEGMKESRISSCPGPSG